MDTPAKVFDPLGDPKDGHVLTQAIIDTIHEPLIVLDGDLRIIVASFSFYKKFDLTHENTRGKFFYDIGDGLWNNPRLRILLEKVIPEHTPISKFEVEYQSTFFGRRTLCLDAREIHFDDGQKKMLVSIFDITEQLALESDREKLILQKDLLLKEMRHRVANSLQLIASILLLKAETVDSKESKAHLEDAHERIMSVATVQEQLDPVGLGEEISVEKYLTNLCKSLARSMIGGRRPITIEVRAGVGTVSSDKAVSLGLLTTELAINAIKHAFPGGRNGNIIVSYSAVDTSWSLSVEDDGVGQSEATGGDRPGLGTSIIGALANQLHAVIKTESSTRGTKISINHAAVTTS